MGADSLGPRHRPLDNRLYLAAFGVLVLVGLRVHQWAAAYGAANFDSDEAVFGLMARHILEGDVMPYMYGQTYLGSIESVLGAVSLAIFGPGVFALRLGAIALFAAFLVVHGMLIRRTWGPSTAVVSLLILVLPSWRMFTWTSRPIGAFSALLFAGTAALLLAELRGRHPLIDAVRLVALGAAIGFGIWSHPMTALYLAPLGGIWMLASVEWVVLHGVLRSRLGGTAGSALPAIAGWASVSGVVLLTFSGGCQDGSWLAAAYRAAPLVAAAGGAPLAIGLVAVSGRRLDLAKKAGLLAAGFLAGNLPMWGWYAFAGVDPETALIPACLSDIPGRVVLVFRSLIPAALVGEPADWMTDMAPILWIAVGILAGAAAWYLARYRHAILSLATLRPLRPSSRPAALWAALLLLPVASSLLSSNTVELGSLRYLLVSWHASAVVLALFFVWVLARARLVGVVLVVLWVGIVGVRGIVDIARVWEDPARRIEGATVQRLGRFLEEHDVRGGYADYWTAYYIDYLLEERVTFTPYNGAMRHQPYEKRVEELERVAFVVREGTPPARIEDPQALARELATRKGAGAGRPDPLERLRTGTVVEREHLKHWHVWIIEGGR